MYDVSALELVHTVYTDDRVRRCVACDATSGGWEVQSWEARVIGQAYAYPPRTLDTAFFHDGAAREDMVQCLQRFVRNAIFMQSKDDKRHRERVRSAWA